MEGTAFYQGPGFRFHPTDEEIVRYYLKKKLTGNLPSCFDYLAVIDIYKFEPWDLPKMSKLKTRDLEWYFFTALDKKYGNSIRTNRATDRGYWKTTGKDRAIKNGEETVGMKKTLVYHLGRAPHGDRSNWVMHEYRMIDETLAKAGVQDIDTSNTVGSAELQSNFCYGECSTHPQYSQAFINERKQLEATLGMYEHEVDQPNNISDLYGGNINSVQDGYNGGTNHNENPLNFNFASEELDQFFDPPDYLTDLTDEYLEANDIKNRDEFVPTEIDPSVAAMLDEYLACPDDGDDDVSKYICFDSPLNARSEIPIASYGQPIIEQNVEGETYGSSLTNKHVFEAQSGNEDLPKEDLAASNWVSGDANTFAKHANRLLANIPAPPAFASEFPAKELACEIHPAAESSNSAHITAASPWVLYLSCCCPSYSFQRKILDVGFSHTNILRSIVHHACLRFPNLASVSGISSQIPSRSKSSEPNKSFPHREGAQKVFVIFGGDTSERQVSLMSGTNVWLNLLGFNDSLLRLITGNSAYNLNEETDVAPFEHLYLPN